MADRNEPEQAAGNPGSGRRHRVVIIGGGFAGLNLAQSLKRAPVDITLIDRRNFHLFQPLLYQVATGGLSPGDISSPLRAVLKHHRNTRVMMGDVTDIDPHSRSVILRDGTVPYDTLVVATGAGHHYFGNDHWSEAAPGLKTVEDAIKIRRRIFTAFEAAERETDSERRTALMTFVVVGGGPTGVELAGALSEIANETLKRDFRAISTTDSRIILIEALDRVLVTYHESLSSAAARSLRRLKVDVMTSTRVTSIDNEGVTIRQGDTERRIPARTVLWGAGIQASPLGRVLADRAGADIDKIGRVIVEPDLSVSNHREIFVIGDLANFPHQPGYEGEPLAGIAPVAMAQGRYVARVIKRRLAAKPCRPFVYFDKGTMATIGRAAAVAQIRGLRLSGILAWFTWLFVHLLYLVEFGNRLVVLTQWAWNYTTRNRGARLITPVVDPLLKYRTNHTDDSTSQSPDEFAPSKHRP